MPHIFVENWTNSPPPHMQLDHIWTIGQWTCCVYRGRRASGQGQLLASAMPRTQNRAGKGSTILQIRCTLPIYVYYSIYQGVLHVCVYSRTLSCWGLSGCSRTCWSSWSPPYSLTLYIYNNNNIVLQHSLLTVEW